MRCRLLACALASLPGCATLTYTSNRSALEVAECIAGGWRKAPTSGYELPVSLTKNEQIFLVGVELRGWFSLPVLGTKHPTHSVWAEVSESAAGSATEYLRAYQIAHAAIDRIVQDCQEAK